MNKRFCPFREKILAVGLAGSPKINRRENAIMCLAYYLSVVEFIFRIIPLYFGYFSFRHTRCCLFFS